MEQEQQQVNGNKYYVIRDCQVSCRFATIVLVLQMMQITLYRIAMRPEEPLKTVAISSGEKGNFLPSFSSGSSQLDFVSMRIQVKANSVLLLLSLSLSFFLSSEGWDAVNLI